MIATDFAARGIDFKDINYVINYDFPGYIDDYVNRIRRIARAGSTGTAITFFTRNNANKARQLIELLIEAKQEVPEKLLKSDLLMDSPNINVGDSLDHLTNHTMPVHHTEIKMDLEDSHHMATDPRKSRSSSPRGHCKPSN